MSQTLEEKLAQTEPAKLLDVRGVAKLLGCSQRSVYRLADGGKMPLPMRLGSMVRWNREVLEKWIADGCPACRHVLAKGGGR